MKIHNRLLVSPGKKTKLSDIDERSHKMLQKLIARLDDLQYLLYASKTYSLLIVLQGIDGAGKDVILLYKTPSSCSALGNLGQVQSFSSTPYILSWTAPQDGQYAIIFYSTTPYGNTAYFVLQ